jgi:predicted nucleotidyltransferase
LTRERRIALTKRDKAIAKEFKRKLLDITEIIDFRVFGSRARGDADEYSDMDVFLEVESIDKELKDRILDIAWQVGFDNHMMISPVIFTKEELLDTPLRSSPIVANVNTAGVKI